MLRKHSRLLVVLFVYLVTQFNFISFHFDFTGIPMFGHWQTSYTSASTIMEILRVSYTDISVCLSVCMFAVKSMS